MDDTPVTPTTPVVAAPASPTGTPSGGTVVAAAAPVVAAKPDAATTPETVKPTTVTATEAEAAAAAKAKDGTAADAGEGTLAEVPLSYADFTLPEGVQAAPEAMAGFKQLATDLKLTQAQAQALVTFQSNQVLATQEARAAQATKWKDDLVKDTDFGGEGGRSFEASLSHVAQALSKFGSPELRTVLSETGLGNHPAVAKFFAKIGKLANGESHIVSGQNGQGGTDIAKRMFPTAN